MKYIIALLLLTPMAAWAQTDTSTPPKRDSNYFLSCFRGDYPPDAPTARAQVTVALDLRVTVDGTTKDVVVTKSSGIAAVDQKTLACFTAGRYAPATHNGQPVEVPRHEEIEWTIDERQSDPAVRVRFDADQPPPVVTGPQAIGKPHVCYKDYPATSFQPGNKGATTVAFTITTQGTVTDVHLRQSSGDEQLDDAAITCASQWLYKPAMKDGQPVAMSWVAKVNWVSQ